jgi:hypothetical protein
MATIAISAILAAAAIATASFMVNGFMRLMKAMEDSIPSVGSDIQVVQKELEDYILTTPANRIDQETLITIPSSLLIEDYLEIFNLSDIEQQYAWIFPSITFEQKNYIEINANGHELKQIYNSIKDAPNYPIDFETVNNGTTQNKITNQDLLDELRKIEKGQWKKVYKDGYDSSGKKISIHYFQSESGKVFDVKVKKGWSNNR